MGQALVETSFVLLALILMIVAILDFGQLLFFHQMMTERARAGARWASVNSYDPNDPWAVKNVVVFNSPAPGEIVNGTGLFGLTTDMVTVTSLPSTNDVHYIQVQIDFPIHFYTPLLAKSFTSRFRVVRPVESLGSPN